MPLWYKDGKVVLLKLVFNNLIVFKTNLLFAFGTLRNWEISDMIIRCNKAGNSYHNSRN